MLIDIHSHLLPGIDDGAKTIDESLALLRLAEADGIARIVLTPHLHLGRYDNTPDTINAAFQTLQQTVEREGIDIEMAVAAEVRFDVEILSLLAKDRLPLYGQFEGQRFMLLELPHGTIPVGCDVLVKQLLKRQITPVIAHPERNRELLKSPQKIKPLVQLGCWFQLTAGSIVGQFGEGCQNLALQLLEQDLVHIVATDAHNVKYRPPNLSVAKAFVTDRFGEAHAKKLFLQNPFNITSSLFV